MMKVSHSCLIALTLALALSISLSGAKKVESTIRGERKVRSAAIVKDATCSSNGFCFYNDGVNSWCVTPQTPML